MCNRPGSFLKLEDQFLWSYKWPFRNEISSSAYILKSTICILSKKFFVVFRNNFI
ncbi:hypothetical protein [Mycoplasma miroungirhinis]|uniref:Uncharacterized protein n=1 Tax=Mycoplasma miroungirhinis TaxID=754516 RepID=A0A6M4JAJ3_9MOLU|nr:hypothetical protein [Mycoplasma miroungirhinis]QJR43920.1 hypothetical protein HLA92_00430 [Mycoplasma miroungirhinis]